MAHPLMARFNERTDRLSTDGQVTMPRDARDLDPTNVVHAFAKELRSLRDAAPARVVPGKRNRHPRPWSVTDVADVFAIGTSTIFNALNGQRLPARVTVDAMVIAWAPGGADDLAAWQRRRADANTARQLALADKRLKAAEAALAREQASAASKKSKPRARVAVSLTPENERVLRTLTASRGQSRTEFLRELMTSQRMEDAGYARAWRSPDEGHILIQRGDRLVS